MHNNTNSPASAKWSHPPLKQPFFRRAATTLRKDVHLNFQLYMLMLLPLAYLIVFCYVPMYGVQIAFRKYSPARGITGSQWVGLEHFFRFFNTYHFVRIIRNTLSIGIYSLLAGFPFPILLALLLNVSQYRRLRKSVQMITYAPYFISTVVMVSIITQFFDTRFGIVNQALSALGIAPISFMSEIENIQSLYVWSGVWQSAGWGSIIYLAALSGVDEQQHEAAIVDGASILQRVRHIDIPGILPTIVIMLIMSSGSILSVGFEKIYLMQNDTNMEVTDVISTYIYRVGLFSKRVDYSYGTAVGLFNTVINFIMLAIVNGVSRRVSEHSLW